MDKILITQRVDKPGLLCYICWNTFSDMDMLKRHLKGHDETYNCPICKYASPRKGAVKTLKHTKEMIAGLQQQLTPTKINPVDPELHLKLHLINQTHHKLTAIYINKHYLKIKKSSWWILHEQDILPRRSSRP